MTDLVKSVLGGVRALIVGWILPIFLALQLASGLVLPAFNEMTVVDQFLTQSVTSREFTLLAVAAVVPLALPLGHAGNALTTLGFLGSAAGYGWLALRARYGRPEMRRATVTVRLLLRSCAPRHIARRRR